MTEPRYIVTELSGYNITHASTANGSVHKAWPVTDVAVHDSWYCYRTVAAFPAARGVRLRHRKRAAARLARRLNREHERWLHGCVA